MSIDAPGDKSKTAIYVQHTGFVSHQYITFVWVISNLYACIRKFAVYLNEKVTAGFPFANMRERNFIVKHFPLFSYMDNKGNAHARAIYIPRFHVKYRSHTLYAAQKQSFI